MKERPSVGNPNRSAASPGQPHRTAGHVSIALGGRHVRVSETAASPPAHRVVTYPIGYACAREPRAGQRSPFAHPHLDKPLRTAHLDSAPVSRLKSWPPQPVRDERERRAPGSKNAPRAQSGPAPRKPRAPLRDEGRGRRDAGRSLRRRWPGIGSALAPTGYTCTRGRAREGRTQEGVYRGVLPPKLLFRLQMRPSVPLPRSHRNYPRRHLLERFSAGFGTVLRWEPCPRYGNVKDAHPGGQLGFWCPPMFTPIRWTFAGTFMGSLSQLGA